MNLGRSVEVNLTTTLGLAATKQVGFNRDDDISTSLSSQMTTGHSLQLVEN